MRSCPDTDIDPICRHTLKFSRKPKLWSFDVDVCCLLYTTVKRTYRAITVFAHSACCFVVLSLPLLSLFRKLPNKPSPTTRHYRNRPRSPPLFTRPLHFARLPALIESLAKASDKGFQTTNPSNSKLTN